MHFVRTNVYLYPLFIQKILIISSVGMISGSYYCTSVVGKPLGNTHKRINILFLMSDQHRGDCVGASGADWVKTPILTNCHMRVFYSQKLIVQFHRAYLRVQVY